MPRFVVFLRAINVGGHIVAKGKLQEAFVSLGFRNISTYKQSGNVLFETDFANPQDIAKKIKEKLRQLLGYEVGVFVCTIHQLKQIIELDPFKGQDANDTSFQVTFLADVPQNFTLKLPLMIPNSTAEIISVKDAEVFSATHGHGDGGKPNPFIESKLKVQATTRNLNILKEIVERYKEE